MFSFGCSFSSSSMMAWIGLPSDLLQQSISSCDTILRLMSTLLTVFLFGDVKCLCCSLADLSFYPVHASFVIDGLWRPFLPEMHGLPLLFPMSRGFEQVGWSTLFWRVFIHFVGAVIACRKGNELEIIFLSYFFICGYGMIRTRYCGLYFVFIFAI